MRPVQLSEVVTPDCFHLRPPPDTLPTHALGQAVMDLSQVTHSSACVQAHVHTYTDIPAMPSTSRQH